MANEITFYVSERGDMPVVEFLNSLNDKEAAKCFNYFDLLLERGNNLPANIIRHIKQGLWELRPEFGGTEFRFFYFVVIDGVFFMLHAVKKKSQKVNRKDIKLALKRMKESSP